MAVTKPENHVPGFAILLTFFFVDYHNVRLTTVFSFFATLILTDSIAFLQILS